MHIKIFILNESNCILSPSFWYKAQAFSLNVGQLAGVWPKLSVINHTHYTSFTISSDNFFKKKKNLKDKLSAKSL